MWLAVEVHRASEGLLELLHRKRENHEHFGYAIAVYQPNSLTSVGTDRLPYRRSRLRGIDCCVQFGRRSIFLLLL
jgi:hypothetical protein